VTATARRWLRLLGGGAQGAVLVLAKNYQNTKNSIYYTNLELHF
jgi:hypothetical protein